MAITVVVLFVAISVGPTAVAAVDFPSDGDWENSFTDNDDDVGDSNYNPLKKVYVDSTGEEKILFKTNISDDVTNNGLTDSSGDALQIYIDTGGVEGIDKNTGSPGGWGTFFDGLDAMNADYRVTARTDSVVVEEHEGDIFFNTVRSVDESGDNAYKLKNFDGDTNASVNFALDRDTIGNPETLDVKFAYIDGAYGSASLGSGEFGWAPKSSVRLGGADDGVSKTATVTTNVTFGDEDVDDDATVDIVLTDDNDNEAGVAEDINYDSDGTLSRTFTVNPENFNGEGAEFSVEVDGDDDYNFERAVDNTQSVANVVADGSITEKIGISTLEADVDLSGVSPNEDASIEFNLADKDGTSTETVNETLPDGTFTQTFTVNSENFDGNGNLTVELVGDEDYPYEETQNSPGVTKGNSADFGSDFVVAVGHDFTLDPNTDNPTISGDEDTFTLTVSLGSTSAGQGIHTVDHYIDFDSTNLVDDAEGLDDITIDDSVAPPDVTAQNISITDGGEVRVLVYNSSSSGQPIVSSGDGKKDIYEISFEYEDGLQSELPKDSTAIEFTPSTSDATEVLDTNDDQLSFTSSLDAPDDTIAVNNNQNRITSAEVTHLSRNANMGGFESFRYRVSVETNDATVNSIELTGDDVTGGSTVTETCPGESSCTVTFEQTPSDNTFSGDYSEDKISITAVMPGSNLDIDTQNEGVESDDLNVTVRRKGDFADTGSATSITTNDIRDSVDYIGTEATGETWTDDQRDAASYDVTGDGEVGVTDVTTIIDEYT
jgi:hypothetical protein